MKRCNNCGWFNLDSATQCEKCEEESFDIIEESPAEESAPVVEEPKAEPVVEEPAVEVAAPEEPVAAVVEEPKEESRPNTMMATIAVGAKGVSLPDMGSKAEKKNLAATVMDARAALQLDSEEESCPKCCYPISGDMEYCPNCGATIRTKKVADPQPVCKNTVAEEQSEPAKVVNATVALGAEEPAIAASEDKASKFAKATVALGGELPAEPEQPKASEDKASKFAKATVALGGETPAKAEQPKASEDKAAKFAKATVAIGGAQVAAPKPSNKNLKATVREISTLVVDDSDENTFRLEPVDALGEAPIVLKLDDVVEIQGKRYKFVK